MGFLPVYETTIVTDKRIYSTDKPVHSHIVLKRAHRIPEAVFNNALNAVYSPSRDFLSITSDLSIDPDKFRRLYDFLDAKYPSFGLQTRILRGMFGSEERVGDYIRYSATDIEPEDPEISARERMRERLLAGIHRRPVRVRRHMRRRG